jgi:hypothetical protein
VDKAAERACRRKPVEPWSLGAPGLDFETWETTGYRELTTDNFFLSAPPEAAHFG